MKDSIKEKLKSKVVWITAVPIIANMIATFVSPEYAEAFSTQASGIITLLALFGILNNPNDKENF